MTALLHEKLLQVIEGETNPDAKTLRDCVAVLKELTALAKDSAAQPDSETGVVILPEVKEEL